jgi:hypothetical protein
MYDDIMFQTIYRNPHTDVGNDIIFLLNPILHHLHFLQQLLTALAV